MNKKLKELDTTIKQLDNLIEDGLPDELSYDHMITLCTAHIEIITYFEKNLIKNYPITIVKNRTLFLQSIINGLTKIISEKTFKGLKFKPDVIIKEASKILKEYYMIKLQVKSEIL